MVLKRITVISIALCLAIAGASATAAESRAALEQFIDHSFPDNSDIRAKFSTRLITAPKEQVWDFGSKVQASKAGQVLVKSVKRSDDFLVQFVNGSDGKFADCSLGSYVIERNCKTGYILQAKVFLEDDPSCYARLYPQGEGTKLDIVMYGAVVKKGLYISGLIYHILTMPFSEIVDQTDRAFDWGTVFKLGKQNATAGIVADLRSIQAASQSEAKGPHIELASHALALLRRLRGAGPNAANDSRDPSLGFRKPRRGGLGRLLLRGPCLEALRPRPLALRARLRERGPRPFERQGSPGPGCLQALSALRRGRPSRRRAPRRPVSLLAWLPELGLCPHRGPGAHHRRPHL